MLTDKDNYPSEERRRFPRIPAAFVEYSTIEETSFKKHSFTENVSSVGICILVSEEVKINTPLSFKITLPDSEQPIEAKGVVVWVKKSSFLDVKGRKHFDLGVEFVEMGERDRQRISQYISEHIDKK